MAVTFVADRKNNMGQLLTNIFKALLSLHANTDSLVLLSRRKTGMKKLNNEAAATKIKLFCTGLASHQ